MAKTAGRIGDREQTRLDAAAWIAAALDILAESGVDGVRIEPLARHLSVTKGSFYWHFADRGALLDAMLDDWRRKATLAIIDRLESSGEQPADRLRRLLDLPFAGRRSDRGADVELAFRLWARSDERAAAALAEIDELRLRYFARLFEAIGFTPEEARARAILAYSYIRVAPSMRSRRSPAERAACETALLHREPAATPHSSGSSASLTDREGRAR